MKVFVYGSLRTNGPLNRLLENDKLLGESKTKKEFSLYSLGPFPALVNAGDTAVVGEVYEVSQQTLDRLDMAEGHPHFYLRTLITLEDEAEVSAYLIPNIEMYSCDLIPSGDWMKYLEE